MNTLYFDPTKQVKPFNLPISRELANLVKSERGQCYRNSYEAMQYLPDETTYHEGYAMFVSERFFNLWHHGWLELNGEIIDNYPDLDWNRYVVIYIKGREYSKAQANEIWKRKKIGNTPHRFYLRDFVHAVRIYHAAMKPEERNPNTWNPLWFTTAVKLIFVYLTRKVT